MGMKKWLLALLAGIFVLSLAVVSDTGAAKAAEKYTYNGYESANGFDVKITDAKGKELKVGDSFNEGTEFTFKITLQDMYEWTDSCYVYVDDWYYMDESGEFTCTPSGDFWVYAYPARKYAVTFNADSHITSYEFVGAPEKTVVKAADKDYVLEKANGLSSNSITVRCIFEEGYELDTVTTKVDSCRIIRTSDCDTFELTFDSYETGKKPTVFTLTSKKAASRQLEGKLTTVAPTVKKNKAKDYDNHIKYTVTLGKGKKATKFVYDGYTYDDGDGSVWFDKVTVGSAASSYEVIDLSKATKLPEDVLKDLVYRIYHLYKQGKFAKLKAVYLPSNVSVPIWDYWMDEYSYYPVEVITLK